MQTFVSYAQGNITKDQILKLLEKPLVESNKEDVVYLDNGQRYMKLMAPPDGLYLSDIKYDIDKHFLIDC